MGHRSRKGYPLRLRCSWTLCLFPRRGFVVSGALCNFIAARAGYRGRRTVRTPIVTVPRHVPVRNDVGPDGPVGVASRPQLEHVAPTRIAIARFVGSGHAVAPPEPPAEETGFDNEPITLGM